MNFVAFSGNCGVGIGSTLRKKTSPKRNGSPTSTRATRTAQNMTNSHVGVDGDSFDVNGRRYCEPAASLHRFRRADTLAP